MLPFSNLSSYFMGRSHTRSEQYTTLKPDLIVSTVERLQQRIGDRFPDSGLLRVCSEFHQLATECADLARRLEPPFWPVRVAALAAAILLVGLVGWAFAQLLRHFTFDAAGMADLLQTMEAAINELIFLGLALYFLMNLETRIKQRTALQALHRLRSLAHVVDMHQLTKDPVYVLGTYPDTHASPQRTLTRYQLSRYLDYCSEMLALNAKVAVLFAHSMDDEVVLNAVNDIESLTQGMSGKIWQKIMILDLAERTGQ